MFSVELHTYNGRYDLIEADKLIVSTIDGQRTLLTNHMPIMMILQPGELKAVKNGVTTSFMLSDGVLLFENNHVTITANEIESEGRTSSNRQPSEEKDLIVAKAELAKALRQDED